MRKLIIMFLAVMLSSISVYGQNVVDPISILCNPKSTDFYVLKTGKYPTNFRAALRFRKLSSDSCAVDFIFAELNGSDYSEFDYTDRKANINSVFAYAIFDGSGEVALMGKDDNPTYITIGDYKYRMISFNIDTENARGFCENRFILRVLRLYFRDSFGSFDYRNDTGKDRADIVIGPDEIGLLELYGQLRKILNN